jgi:hypothetical protein
MKKLAILFLFGFVFNFLGMAQEGIPQATPVAAPVVNPNAPEIVFEKDQHDFGNIKHGGNGVYEFKFKNTGKEPLIISNAAGSCGCTVPTWPKEPIKKGETGIIKVSYDTKRVGGFTKTVTLTSNAKTATKVLTIKGVVEPGEPVVKEPTAPLKKTNEGMPLENQSKFKF